MVATRRKRAPALSEEPPTKKVKAEGEVDAVENAEGTKDNAESNDIDAAKQSLASKSQKQKKKKNDSADDMQWICGECKEAECLIRPDTSEFLICDGQCERVFHYPCAGLNELPSADEDWICKDCASKRHQCALCQEYGNDNEDVFLCSKDKCGLFFHLSCLELEGGVEVKMVPKEEPATSAPATPTTIATSDDSSNNDDEEMEGGTTTTLKPVFTCPAHNCWTCTQNDMIEKERSKAEAERKQAAAENNGKKKKAKRKKKKGSTIFQQKTETRLYVSSQ